MYASIGRYHSTTIAPSPTSSDDHDVLWIFPATVAQSPSPAGGSGGITGGSPGVLVGCGVNVSVGNGPPTSITELLKNGKKEKKGPISNTAVGVSSNPVGGIGSLLQAPKTITKIIKIIANDNIFLFIRSSQ
jgi:hypothetical protein